MSSDSLQIWISGLQDSTDSGVLGPPERKRKCHVKDVSSLGSPHKATEESPAFPGRAHPAHSLAAPVPTQAMTITPGTWSLSRLLSIPTLTQPSSLSALQDD